MKGTESNHRGHGDDIPMPNGRQARMDTNKKNNNISRKDAKAQRIKTENKIEIKIREGTENSPPEAEISQKH